MNKNIDIKILSILKDLEAYRQKLESGELTPGNNDHTLRMCQAIVAEYGPFESRAAWKEALKTMEKTEMFKAG